MSDCRNCQFDSCTPCKPFHIQKLKESGFLDTMEKALEENQKIKGTVTCPCCGALVVPPKVECDCGGFRRALTEEEKDGTHQGI